MVAKEPTPVEPLEPSGSWEGAELEAWRDPRLAARRRSLFLKASFVVLILASLIGLSLWTAAAHYARGVRALEVHSYTWAVTEFAAARFLAFPYRDARSLEEQARQALAAEEALRNRTDARQAGVVTQLEKASSQLEADDADGVLATLLAIKAADLQAALRGGGAARRPADMLATDLTLASRGALSHRAWRRAGSYAAALLILEPSSERAARLGARAQKGQDLSAMLGRAKDAARHGRWRTALRLGLAVLAAEKGFPGAAAVVADARHALAPKPKPAKTQTAAATTPANPPTQPVTRPTTPTAPPPPAPP